MHSISNAIASKEELMTPVIMPVVNSKNELPTRENSSDNLKGNRANRHVLDNIENDNSNSVEILEDLDINFENGISNKRRRVNHDYRKLSSSGRLSDDESSSCTPLLNSVPVVLPTNQLPISNGIFIDVSSKLIPCISDVCYITVEYFLILDDNLKQHDTISFDLTNIFIT